MLRLVQLTHPTEGRKVAVVEVVEQKAIVEAAIVEQEAIAAQERLRLVYPHRTIYACAAAALQEDVRLSTAIGAWRSDRVLDYEAVYTGSSEWRLLPAFDHPDEPARCLVSGTGLTHRKSADNRHAMHRSSAGQALSPTDDTADNTTDSLRMYAWGDRAGRPSPGAIGVQPEWFYKGCGTVLRAHGEPLDVPNYAEDGGEEPEIAGAYLIDATGRPWRIGFAIGNEFSDHQMESRNYLYLAPSKLRNCALGPELLIGAPFDALRGTVVIERQGQPLWSQTIVSGEANMVHTLANLEYHHFKYAAHRRPGDAHVHFFGTGGFSFGAGVRLEEGDVMGISFEGYGRPLRNPLRIDTAPPTPLEIGEL